MSEIKRWMDGWMYGRPSDVGSVGCAADVLGHLDRKCSGRRSCRMMIPDATLHGIHPCPKELMPYLEASYLCVKGIE